MTLYFLPYCSDWQVRLKEFNMTAHLKKTTIEPLATTCQLNLMANINQWEKVLYNNCIRINNIYQNTCINKSNFISLVWNELLGDLNPNEKDFLFFYFWCFNATFSNISAISWWPVLVVKEAGENHRPWASNW